MGRNKRILLPSQSSNRQSNTLAKPSDLQPHELLSLSESYNSEGYHNSSSDQSSSSQEAMVEKFKRKLSMYEEMLDKKRPKLRSMIRKKKVKDPPNEICSRQMQLNHSLDIIQKSFERAMDEANMHGYAYGIIFEDGSVVTGSSPSLCKWWEETVRFEHNGTAAADLFYLENQLTFDPTKDTEPPRPTYEILMELSDGTLGSVLSAVMQCCDPPQRKFPLDKKVSPPWWPTGNEPWWDQITIEKHHAVPPYKKPHDLRKTWKAAVVIAVIKHTAPGFGKLAHVVKQSKNLQDRMSVREMNAWNSVLKEEMKMYARENSSNSSYTHDHFEGFQPQLLQLQPSPEHQQQHEVVPKLSLPPSEQRMLSEGQVESSPWLNDQQRTLRYTCDHPRCLHHDINFGFRTVELRDQHRCSCGFLNCGAQFGAPVGLQPFPYQDVIPLRLSPMLQTPSYPSQQMANSLAFLTMTFQQPNAAYQEMPGETPEMDLPHQSWSFNNAGIPDYPAMPNEVQDIHSF